LWGAEVNERRSSLNGSLNAGVSRHYTYPEGSGDLTVAVRTPSVLSDYNYSRAEVNSVNAFILKKFEFRSRIFAQAGFGNIPVESQLYLAGANPEALIDNKFTRARGFFPDNWTTFSSETNHFHYGGGLNLRGYAGYLAPEEITQDKFLIQYPSYRGRTGAAWNLEVEFDKLIKIKPKKLTKNFHFDTYLFTDMGIMGTRVYDETRFGGFRMDAGVGTALTIKFSYFDIEPLVIRFDMPLFLNRPPATEEFIEPRFVVGVKRAF
jgi:aminopeptidase N